MSLPRYPHYKDSGVEWLGEVPEHWEAVPFRTFVNIQNGADYKHVEVDEGYPVVGSGGVFAYASEFIYDGESVLLGRKGTIDKPLYFSGRFWTVDTMYWTKIRAGVAGRFAYYTARTIPFDYYSTSTALPSMTKASLSRHVVPRPPIEEQRVIAAFLDNETAKIDALIAEQQRLIELLKEKRQAVISHAVTKGLNPDVAMKPSGIEWLGEVPEHWDVLPLRRVARSVETGGTPSSSRPFSDAPQGLVWYTPGDFGDSLRLTTSARMVAPEVVASGEAQLFPPRSVLVVSIGATLGKVGFAEVASSANQQINAVIPNERIDGYFMAYSLSVKVEAMRFLSNASTIGIMNQEKTKAVWLAVPPLAEQRVISEQLDSKTDELDMLATEARCVIGLLQERRTALISAAVTGKIDVRNVGDRTAA